MVLTNARGIHGDLMADYAIGVMVMLQFGFPRLLRLQQARTWQHQYTEPLAGKTLGVLGVGAIGGEIARRGAAMGMTVLGMRREPRPAEGVARMFGPDGLGELLPRCDFVVVVVPATPETRRMLGERELRAMRRGAHLINVARGSVVDEAALVRALADGWLGGAALDVFEIRAAARGEPAVGDGQRHRHGAHLRRAGRVPEARDGRRRGERRSLARGPPAA